MATVRIMMLLMVLATCSGCKTILCFTCQKNIYQHGDPFPYETEAKIQVEKEF